MSQIGFRWESKSHEIVQVRNDGFTFSKLPTYTSWIEVQSKALTLWTQYLEFVQPVAVTRLAVRYINELNLPSAELTAYLAKPPELPAAVPQSVSEFLFRTVVRDEQRNLSCILNQAGGAADAGRLRLWIDIDVFRQVRLEPGQDWQSLLAPLHELKNEIFFGLLTDETITRFE